MNELPYTYKQAATIAESFQFLVGRPYDKNFTGTTPVLAVLVAPAEEEAQELFMDLYERTGKADLRPFSSENGYDVIVVTRYQYDPELYLWMDVKTFAHSNIQLQANNTANHVAIIPLERELAA